MTNRLDVLCNAVATGEFEDNGWLALSAVSWRADDILLSLELDPGDATSRQRWNVVCERPRAHRLQNDTVNDFAVHEDHVLLLPFQQLQAGLYSSSARNPAAVAGELWAAHRRYTDDWFPPETFLNPAIPLIDLLGAPSGLLAQGPVAILSEYEGVLTRYDIACSQLRERDPKRWNGVAESEVLKVLTIGRSFVIAEAFTAATRDAVV
jgi:hypothetical protein